MAVYGTKGTFRFDIATSIPQAESLISGDTRYTREFTKNEGIRILVPLNSGLCESDRGVYGGFAKSYNENVYFNSSDPNPQLANLPSEIITRDHNPDSHYTTGWHISQMPDHMFAGEGNGKLLITITHNSFFKVAGLPTSGETLAIRSAGFVQAYGYDFAVPYLWGSIIEGVTSGARRFIIGPMFAHVSNPSLDPEVAFADYVEVAISGTGPYGQNVLRFVMPESGVDLTDSFDKTRHDLFNYVSDSNVKTSDPINKQFFKNTPFDSGRIDYSGFRIRERKTLPSPYNTPDKETTDSIIHGPSVEPEKTVYGTSGNQETFSWWSVGALSTDNTRRHAFAITKRHVLAFPYARHAYPFSPDNPERMDFYGFPRGVTGKIPFTDSAEYGKGDKILFWDKVNETVIERTIIDTELIDVEAIRTQINKIVAGAIPRLETSWTCVEQYIEELGLTGLVCSSTDEGYAVEALFDNWIATQLDYEPVGGNVCTALVPQVIPWKGYRVTPNSEASYTDLSRTLAEIRLGKRTVNKFFYGDYLIGATGGFDYLNLYLPDGGFGLTSASQPNQLYPNLSVGVRSDGATGGARILTPYNFVRLPNEILESEFLYAAAKEDSTIDEAFSSAAFSPRLKDVAGVVGFNNSQLVAAQSGQGLSAGGVVPEGGNVNQFPAIPPEDDDPTLVSSSIDSQFSYLPTAARNAVREYFPHGLNNIFFGSLSPNDPFRRSITWNYIVSHFRGLFAARTSIHLLDQDLPDGVTPISFVDARRSVLQKHEMVFDDQMRGYLITNCPPKGRFSPYWSWGDPEQSADGWGGYAIGSEAVAYTNPYGQQTITLEFAKVGRCDSSYDETFLEDCQEERGATSGPRCRWNVWTMSIGSGGDVTGLGNVADTQIESGCYACWYENRSNPLATKLPTNMEHSDRLMDFSKNYGMFSGGDIPAPVFTYTEDGVPIMSRIITGSSYRSNLSDYRYLFEYSVTGPHRDFIKMNDYVFQSHDGSTSQDGMINGFAKMRVHRYTPDSGRLTLAMDFSDIMTGNLIYSNDHLLNCNASLLENGGYLYNGPSECSSETKTFPHDLGKAAYIHNAGNGSWAQVLRGGPRSLGYSAGFTLWYDGLLFGAAVPWATDETCSSPTQEETSAYDIDDKKSSLPNPLGTYNEKLFATHNLGSAFSDQKMYMRRSNPNIPSPFFYFGRPIDIFNILLTDLNQRNGVTGQYSVNKKVITYDPEKTDLSQPLASLAMLPETIPTPFIVNTAPGVYSAEKQFLK